MMPTGGPLSPGAHGLPRNTTETGVGEEWGWGEVAKTGVHVWESRDS